MNSSSINIKILRKEDDCIIFYEYLSIEWEKVICILFVTLKNTILKLRKHPVIPSFNLYIREVSVDSS